jgi:hypothetical protein
LIGLVKSDPEFLEFARWTEALREWIAVCNSDDYWRYCKTLEAASGFEPRASEDEFSALRQFGVRLFREYLIRTARASHAQGKKEKAMKIASILRALSDFDDWDVDSELCDKLVARLEEYCEHIESDCSSKVSRVDNNTLKDISRNKEVCLELSARFDIKVRPILNDIVDLCGEESAVARRSKESCAQCLRLVAVAFTWADDLQRSKQLLEKCVELSVGTASEFRMQDELDKINEKLEQSKFFGDLKVVKSAPPLITYWGFGLNVVHNPFRRETVELLKGSYMATYALVALWVIPILPIARYRIMPAGDGRISFRQRVR